MFFFDSLVFGESNCVLQRPRMAVKKEKLRYILQYHYDQGERAEKAAKKICDVYGPNTVSNATAKRWFRRFRSGNMDVEDETRSGRPIVENVNKIMEVVEADRHATTYSISQELRVSQKTVWNHLNKAGLRKVHDAWVPSELTRCNLLERVDACDALLRRSEADAAFLTRLLIGDEKLVTFEYNTRKRSWSKRDEATEHTTKKMLLCVWWDWKGVVHHEVLSSGESLTPDVYCHQLTRLRAAVEERRRGLTGIVCHRDNARPHVTPEARQRLREFGWEVASLPAHSPDLAPSDYHLFKHMQNFLDGKKPASRDACEREMTKFLTSREPDFFSRGIMALPGKWAKVVEEDGAYLI